MLVNYLVTRLQQAMGNPALQGEAQQQLHTYGFSQSPKRRECMRSLLKRLPKEDSMVRGVENPYEKLLHLLEDAPPSKRRGHASHEEPLPMERNRSEPSNTSMEDAAQRRRRSQRSPTSPKRKRSPHSPPHREPKRERGIQRRKRRERGHALLHLHHLLPLPTKVVAIPPKNPRGEDIKNPMPHGKGSTSSRSLKREERTLLFSPVTHRPLLGSTGATCGN
ncbi:hypothetical protein L7F22_063051 [Adiantum nelumboides]|nr:hypothetical protein [Adiantum nelumboides]